MGSYNIGDEVWWFGCESTKGNVYPDWLHLFKGRVVWKSPHEEIIHVYENGCSSIAILLDDAKRVFDSRENALIAMSSRILEIEGSKNV
jgi:hypothetical protein